jgi:hypothetical protein
MSGSALLKPTGKSTSALTRKFGMRSIRCRGGSGWQFLHCTSSEVSAFLSQPDASGVLGLRSFQNFGLPCKVCHETSRGDWDLAVNPTQDFHAIAEMRLRK